MADPRASGEHGESGEHLALLAAIVDSSDDAILSKTLDGIITSWNRSAERIFGWVAEEAIGQSIRIIIPRDRWQEEDEILAHLSRGERVDHFDTVRATRDGRLVDMSITVSPVRDRTGRIVGASKIGRDITERRRVEEQRLRLLEREQEARRRAEALNRARDELLAAVSHELRTPLNAIFGWARMLKTTEMDEAQRARALDAIMRSASAQARLVEDLLDVSRVVTGRLRLELSTVDILGVIEAALAAVRPAAAARKIQLTTALDGSLGLMVGAADRLQQVMWNLLMNAVKFTPRGGRVDVSATRADGSVVIVVADDGEGIDPDTLPHVFEPFRQEDSSGTRAHGGLGLGLTLVRQLVDLHGGRVTAASPGKGKGVVFTVTLPVTGPAAGAGEDRQAAAARAAGTPLAGLRVLLVGTTSSRSTSGPPCCATRAPRCARRRRQFVASDAVRCWEPSVVVTDLAMPGEDGFVLPQAMRAAFSRRAACVPIIAVTAHGTPENRCRALREGFDLYLVRPVDPETLTAAIADAARRAAA